MGFKWERDEYDRGRHFVMTNAGTYEVKYVCTRDEGSKFVGMLNGRELRGVSGDNVAIVKAMIEERITVARKIARGG